MWFGVVDTALGTFGLGWTRFGVSRICLPDATIASTMARMQAWGGEPVEPFGLAAEVEERLVAYAEGESDAFHDVALDLAEVPEFNRRCYAEIRLLSWGETTTYGAIAQRLGDLSLSRAVGAAMGANPVPLIIPCHRVLAAGGRPGGFSAPGGIAAKQRLLALEHAASPEGQLGFGF